VRETKDAHDSNLVDVASVCCWWRSLEERKSSVEKGHNCLIPPPNDYVLLKYAKISISDKLGGRRRHLSQRVLPKCSKVTDPPYSIFVFTIFPT